AYLLVISVMFVTAWWHGNGWGLAGAVLFVVSDTVLGRRVFVPGNDTTATAVAVMATYHLALVGLLLAVA
ncbi:MAG TPA: lysoplasmalogenase family protein, partial [Acidimicrobiales bacterium]